MLYYWLQEETGHTVRVRQQIRIINGSANGVLLFHWFTDAHTHEWEKQYTMHLVTIFCLCIMLVKGSCKLLLGVNIIKLCRALSSWWLATESLLIVYIHAVDIFYIPLLSSRCSGGFRSTIRATGLNCSYCHMHVCWHVYYISMALCYLFKIFSLPSVWQTETRTHQTSGQMYTLRSSYYGHIMCSQQLYLLIFC